MGIGPVQWNFLSACLQQLGGYQGKYMLELGYQYLRASLMKKLHWSDKVAKYYFEHLGFVHTSIDIKGKHGALPYDLSRTIPDPFLVGRFDVITNSGVTEHVKPMASQLACFENMHRFAKVGCLFIHMVPEYGSYPKHAQVYYCTEFFRVLAELNSYRVIRLERCSKVSSKVLVCACLVKVEDCDFCIQKTAFFENLMWVVHEDSTG